MTSDKTAPRGPATASATPRPSEAAPAPAAAAEKAAEPETEHGGPSGPEPTRYGDWERKGICVDF